MRGMQASEALTYNLTELTLYYLQGFIFYSQTVASGKNVDVRRQLRARSMAQWHGYTPRAHRRRVAPRAHAGRAPHAAAHLTRPSVYAPLPYPYHIE